MSRTSQCMSRCSRDNRRDIGVRVLLALAALSRGEHENATTPLSQGLPSPQKRGRPGRFSHCLEDYLGVGGAATRACQRRLGRLSELGTFLAIRGTAITAECYGCTLETV